MTAFGSLVAMIMIIIQLLINIFIDLHCAVKQKTTASLDKTQWLKNECKWYENLSLCCWFA